MKTFDPKIFNGVRVLRAYELATGRLQPDEIHDITMDGQMYNMGYKVVTEDMKSLGLRNNPNILEYKINEWKFLPIKDTKSGKEDFGGIWVARLPSGASSLKKYMKKKLILQPSELEN